MSAQLDRIEEKLDRLLSHLGAGATSPAPPEDTSALDDYAKKHRESVERRKRELFKDDETPTEEGERLVREGWMDA